MSRSATIAGAGLMTLSTDHAEHERRMAQGRANGQGHLIDAHTHSARHRAELDRSAKAGCFYCCEVFAPSEIDGWVDDDDTALCPRCGIDAVIGDASSLPAADKKFLSDMNGFWF